MTTERTGRVRRIAVVTGTRAEYGLLNSTMRAIARHRNLKLQLIVTGMHLLKRFGHTVNDIMRDGWTIDVRIPMQTGDDSPTDQAAGLARGVAGIAKFLERADTDITVVLGDRIEAAAGALAAVTTGRCLAHIHGGDVAVGDFDESLRHAITKLAHVHFPATKSAARRIVRMGEDESRVHCVGAPGIDDLAELVRTQRDATTYSAGTLRSVHARRYRKTRTGGQAASGTHATSDTDVTSDTHVTRGTHVANRCVTVHDSQSPPRSRRALILFHASGRSADREQRTMRAILRSASDAGLILTIIHPNSDRGHTGVVRAIEQHVRKSHDDTTEVFTSLAREAYLRRLIEADVLIGNSSSGIIEAATAGTPVVNVGARQAGRQRAGRSVIDAGETKASIRASIDRAIRSRPIIGRRTVYGVGDAGQRIAHVLARIRLDGTLLRKQCRY